MDQNYKVDLYYGYVEGDCGISHSFELVDPCVVADGDFIGNSLAEDLDTDRNNHLFNWDFMSVAIPDSLIARIKEDAIKEFLDKGAQEKNTKIYYHYTDASNYKAHNSAVIQGVLSPDQKQMILDSLHEGEFFIPGVVGLDVELPWEYDPQDDHPFWTLCEDSFEETMEKPSFQAPTAEQFVSAFVENRDKWEQLGVEYELVMDPDYLDDVINSAYEQCEDGDAHSSEREFDRLL